MNNLSCKDQIITIAKKLYERQMVNTNEGNVSIYHEGRVYITPSQVCKGDLTSEMIVTTDLEGKILEGSYKPSSEIALHLHIYKQRPDVHSVVHDHSPFATAFAIARRPISSKAYTEMIFFYDHIPVVEYGAPGTPAIYKGIEKYICQTDIFLLANHGLVAVGSDSTDAYLKAESVESMAKTLAIAHLLGGEYPLSQGELTELYKLRKEKLNKDPIKS